MLPLASRHDVTFVTTCELLPGLESHAALSGLRSGDASSRSKSIEGFGSVAGGALAGYESASVVSIIFSRGALA
jgi:O-glycosyl hydrolase